MVNIEGDTTDVAASTDECHFTANGPLLSGDIRVMTRYGHNTVLAYTCGPVNQFLQKEFKAQYDSISTKIPMICSLAPYYPPVPAGKSARR